MAVRVDRQIFDPPRNAPEFWLMGCVPGDDEPVLLECGTRQEVELALSLHENEGGYAELFVLGIAKYVSMLEQLDGEQE